MASILNNILNLGELEHERAMITNVSTPPRHQEDSPESDDNSQDDDNGQDITAQAGTLSTAGDIAAFTISTARNLQLTTDGERSLLQFSQVFISPTILFTLLIQRLELNTRLVLIYQQAMLIKLIETYRHHESVMTIQGPEAGDQLVLMDEIKVIYQVGPPVTNH